MNNDKFERYNEEDIKILKRVIPDYEEIKGLIDKKIEEGYSLEQLKDYVETLDTTNITNYNFDYEFDRFFDFNYKDMCLTIWDYNYRKGHSVFLGDTIEVYNDKDMYFVDTFNCIDEIKGIIKDC